MLSQRLAPMLAALACAALLLVPAVAHAATITVDRDDDGGFPGCSLRSAISAANLNVQVNDCAAGEADSLDTIQLPLSVRLTRGGTGEDENTVGDLDVSPEEDSGPLRVVGTGGGPPTITQTVTDRVIDLHNGSLALEGVVVTGGDLPGGALSAEGGGAFARPSSSALTVTNSSVSGNKASFGGGIRMWGNGALAVTNSTVSRNEASVTVGGGISTEGGPLTVTNSTVSRNEADNEGGGIAMLGGELTVTSSTIARNQGPADRGQNLQISLSTEATLRGTIIAEPVGGGANCQLPEGADLTSEGFNLTDDGSCGLDQPSDVTGAPELGALAANGGPTQTHALLPGSPAIDAAGQSCPATDQRGVRRPQGPACDIGAFELVPEAAPSPPSNEFGFGKLKRNKKRGTAKQTVIVPGPGDLDLAKTKKVKGTDKRAPEAGNVKLKIKPKAKAKKKLKRRGKAKLDAAVTYTPDGGTANTKSKPLKLKQKRR